MAYTTVPDATLGRVISEAVVKARLAACVSTVPGVQSTYWWEGKVQSDAEVLLVMKTRRALLPALGDEIKRLHTYDTPELVAQPIVGGLPAYLRWVEDETAGALREAGPPS